ncbi:histidine ammonia-lyase [Cuniculiplasma sp. SKW3]|uniref:histidine ammonia-lyase n=1 Tax=Cuniculiplasma sp. SKW3 TaxID=3400170 RepID=UPI003FD250F4
MELDGENLDMDMLKKIIRKEEKVTLSENAKKNVVKSRNSLMKLISKGEPIYGVNTGFGSLLNKKINREDSEKLQLNLIRSHSSGFGKALSEEKVRAMMLVRANSLARGYSGVSLELIEKILEVLNTGLYPFVPEMGSVGASGDLAPLAHLCLAIIGEGEMIEDSERKQSLEVMKKHGVEPYVLREKEAISFINGTSAITGIGSVELIRAKENLAMASASFSMAFETLRGTRKAFTPWALSTRKQFGQSLIGAKMYSIFSESPRVVEQDKIKIQDAYTLRCTPQVYGAVFDTISYVESVLVSEMNSTTDNPLINEEEYVSSGNFHGEPVAFACDFLAIALTDLGNMIERRLARITDSSLSGLEPFLIKNSGLNSGFMIGQYAAAALCNRNKILAYPGSADSIPTCANQEDHVSMGTNSANKLSEINDNIHRIIATEFVMAAQAMDLSPEGYSSYATRLKEKIREKIEYLHADRPIYRDMDEMEKLMKSIDFIKIVDEKFHSLF